MARHTFNRSGLSVMPLGVGTAEPGGADQLACGGVLGQRWIRP
ncbi:MAG: hypothetical protein BIFFINMI_00283 [Phycisphaerae bacterium]|nr:hypothetical protein [Phycisphaerae bacterium]